MYLIQLYEAEIEHWKKRLSQAKSVEQHNLYLRQLRFYERLLEKEMNGHAK